MSAFVFGFFLGPFVTVSDRAVEEGVGRGETSHLADHKKLLMKGVRNVDSTQILDFGAKRVGNHAPGKQRLWRCVPSYNRKSRAANERTCGQRRVDGQNAVRP